MKLVLSSLFAATLLFAFNASAQYEQFTDLESVPATITQLNVHVYDSKEYGGPCDDSACFRMDVYLNGNLVARWMTSPGKPNHANYSGVWTPEWSEKQFNTDRIYTTYKNKYNESMPYAMFLGATGIAVHASGVVNGRPASHGCLRLINANAKQLNQWMRKAVANGDVPVLKTEHTNPNT